MWQRPCIVAFALGVTVFPGCSKDRTKSDAPAASSRAPGPRKSKIVCTVHVPAGWSRSASPMPDHIAELMTQMRGTRPISTFVLEEVPTLFGSLTEAVGAETRRVDNAWSGQLDFGLIGEETFASKRGSGTLLAFRWRRAKGEPMWLHYRALLQVDGLWVRAIAETVADGDPTTADTNGDAALTDAAGRYVGRETAAIRAMLASLTCSAP